MLADYRDVFARCLAKPLLPFEAYEAMVEGTQRYQTDYALRRFQIDYATRCAIKCPCCLYVGLRNLVFSQTSNERFPVKARRIKHVFCRPRTVLNLHARADHCILS